MTSRPQFSLSIAGRHDASSAAHPAKGGGGFPAQFPGFGRDQIGDLMSFEVAPHVFGGIEFRRIGGQPLDLDTAPGGSDIVSDQDAAVNRSPIPENEDLTANMPLEVSQKTDDLGAFNAARLNLEVEPPERQAANDREAFPVEGFMEDGRLSARRPSANPRRARPQSAFIYENEGSLLPAGFFLIPAT